MQDTIGELRLQILITLISDKPFVCPYTYYLTPTGYIRTFTLSNDCSSIQHREIQMESYDPLHLSVVLLYILVCAYCKPVYTLLFDVQLRMTIETHVLYDTPYSGFTAKNGWFYKNKVV